MILALSVGAALRTIITHFRALCLRTSASAALHPGCCPPFPVLAGLFSVRAGRTWRNLDPSALLLLHTVCILVEAVAHQLYLEGSIPQVMTWEGAQLRLFTGVSALFLYAWSR
ncbi:MAG: hypothetical protein IPN62_06325 [Flavobacteriales bacterium]|nr:hypothetical protein [Flavobacteriales bacterium]